MRTKDVIWTKKFAYFPVWTATEKVWLKYYFEKTALTTLFDEHGRIIGKKRVLRDRQTVTGFYLFGDMDA